LDIIWQRSMKPHYYNDLIYSFTTLKKQEDIHRQFIFKFIYDEWMSLSESNTLKENSFIEYLMKVSRDGRNFSTEEILDHCGTMLVAVS
jgi:protein tyrosine phosphatase